MRPTTRMYACLRSLPNFGVAVVASRIEKGSIGLGSKRLATTRSLPKTKGTACRADGSQPGALRRLSIYSGVKKHHLLLQRAAPDAAAPPAAGWGESEQPCGAPTYPSLHVQGKTSQARSCPDAFYAAGRTAHTRVPMPCRFGYIATRRNGLLDRTGSLVLETRRLETHRGARMSSTFLPSSGT